MDGQASAVSRPVVLYDEDCRFCRFVATILARLDHDNVMALLPFCDPRAVELTQSVDLSLRFQALHVVTRDDVKSAGDAVLLIATNLPRFARFASFVSRSHV